MLPNITLTSILIASCLIAEDKVSFDNGDLISGSIQGINEDESLLFNFAESTEPLVIDPKALSKISFKLEKPSLKKHSERIFLSNGDELPCDLNSLTDKSISFSTSYAGDFVIPRSSVSKISFDNKLQSLVYLGPKSANEWDALESWKVINNTLSVNGRGIAAKKIAELPKNFIVRFTLQWKAENPKFRIHLASRQNTIKDKIDRYYLDYNSAGFQMTRVTPRKYDAFGRHNLRPTDVKNNRLNVELRIDRLQNQIALVLDGENASTFSDTAGGAPLGDWLIFESNQANAENLTVSDIQVLEWQGTKLTQKKEQDLVSPDADILRDYEELTYKGNTKKIESVKGKLTIFFDSKFSKDTLTVPAEKTSVIYLKKNNGAKEQTNPTYLAELVGGGQISLGKTVMKDGIATTSHPILGDCAIKRSSINSLTAPK